MRRLGTLSLAALHQRKSTKCPRCFRDKCKPLKTYECLITDINSKPQINTLTYVSPTDDRATLTPEDVPTEILNNEELALVSEHHRDVIGKEHPSIIKHWDELTPKQKTTKVGKELIYKTLPTVPHYYLDCIELRDTSKAAPHATEYSRR